MPRKVLTSRAAERSPRYATGARLNVVVAAEVRKKLDALAKEEGRTVSEVAREILERGAEERRREQVYAEVERTYPLRRKLYLDLIKMYDGIDEEVGRR